jgi:DNA-binding transcriptional MerR regulator
LYSSLSRDITRQRAPASKAELLTRIRELKAEGFSLKAIADRLNADGVPTISGQGRWQKGTIGNLLAQQGGTSY